MKMFNLFGKSAAFMALVAVCGAVEAAQNGRDGAQNSQTGRSGMMSARMPTIPTTGLTTIGNPAVHVTTLSDTPGINNNVIPTPIPVPVPTPEPEPVPDCPDGGVIDSTYTIDMCMKDVLQCINTGGLQGGLNDLFCNEDVRNAVVNGMMLCQNSIDKCVHDVRVNCRNVYATSSDVWLDFNSRIVQPEYYNFVLKKTGLTPNQAENTCLLLDRNTYGSSFSAVSDKNAVNSEFNNKVGAYNSAQNGMLSKNNPLGADVNKFGYDGKRGHYARWDACKAECLVRVAAYNKDELITNNWLWGVMGDDKPAEVWRTAGTTFTCNKDLFDMSSLLNDTRTAAVVGVGGGTLLGAATGAGIGAANYNAKQKAHNDPCTDRDYRKRLGAKIYASNKGGILRSYAYKNVKVSGGKFTGTPIFDEEDNFNELTEEQCRDLHSLNEKVYLYQSKVDECLATQSNKRISDAVSRVLSNNVVMDKRMNLDRDSNTVQLTASASCDVPSGITQTEIDKYESECKFEPLRDNTTGGLCNGRNECLSDSQISYQIKELKQLLADIAPELESMPTGSKGSQVAKGALIGGATGAGVGGIVTGITALVERSNITCRVGDGLNTVALGKSHTIDSLKDFYVKWNLNLPDVISPTSAVSDLASWKQACSQFNNKLMDCPNVQINLKRGNTYDLVQSACVVSGSICIVNEAVAQSHGIQ